MSMNSQNNPKLTPCPCGSSNSYQNCCNNYISANHYPETAEKLMRSRFSAYCVGAYQYILDTYHASTQPSISAQSLAQEDSATQWLTLDVIESINSGQTATVCFKAYRQHNGEFYCLHENSRFVLEDNRWLYVDGDILADTGSFKPGRNDQCICGSGKKFKRCCG